MGLRQLVVLGAALAVASPAARATLADEKYAFVRAAPCPSTGYRKTVCPGYALVFPACEAVAARMRWATVWEQFQWSAEAQRYCACRTFPVKVLSATTRGKTLQAITCPLPW